MPGQRQGDSPVGPSVSESGLRRQGLRPASILGSMSPDGSRVVVHPADVRGRWIRWRRIAFVALIGFYAVTPLIEVGGHPAIQLDVERRRFYLFGATFNAQDFWMVLLLTLGFAFALLFVTAWRGRVWCGWACPQTVFLEGVYRPIERLIDGSREQRLRTAGGPWTAGRVARFVLKQAIFALASLNIAHAAAAIFVSPKELMLMILEGPAAHPEAFFLVVGFTVILTANFAWFREQFCVVICPYGRMQSVLHDRDSIVVAYDVARGEPRAKLGRSPPGAGLVAGGVSEAAKPGDCIDCGRCVVVCPTAIDIRSGSQMECLACQQCIDACDEVMVKVKRPTGLVGFRSEAQGRGEPRRVMRPRLFVYGALTLLSFGTLGVSLAVRTPFEASVLRARGANAFVVDGGVVRNTFELHLVNKAPSRGRFEVRVTAPVAADVVVSEPSLELESLAHRTVPVSVTIARRALSLPVELTFEVREVASGETRLQRVRFLGPSVGPEQRSAAP